MNDGALVEVVVPQLGEAVSEVRIVEWVKNEGDQVASGDVLFIVDTDKAEVDVDAFVDGVLVEITVADDTATMPGAVVGMIRTPDDADVGSSPSRPDDADAVTPSGSDGADAVTPSPSAEPAAGMAAAEPPRPSSLTTTRSKVRATPKARRLARQLGVDPADATPSRSDGVVSEADISLLATASTSNDGSSALKPPPVQAGEIQQVREETRDPARRIGEAMAARMTESKRTVPHFYLTVDVDMSRALSIRDGLKAAGRGAAPSITSFVIFAAASAMREHPKLISADDDNIATGIGVAVATEAGLVVPTIETGDMPDLESIDERLSGAAERARSLKLQPGDLVPRRITVSNLGMFGVDAFYGIIDPPDTMLITVGATQDRVVARNKEFSVRPMATIGLSADHRKMDGAAVAPFLADLRRSLETLDGVAIGKDG